MDINVFVHDDELAAKIDSLLISVASLKVLILQEIKKDKQIMATIDELVTKVEEQTTVVESVGVFIQGLKDALAAQGIAQAKIDAAFAGVEGNTALAASFTANTPEAPPESGVTSRR